ncbi:hypothetical protein HYX12_03670 [Candidatus Woesearchaeota archaeon]|nr:hypothetical protein [Candidatus Woesearchaeota archaeon]
MEDAEQRNNTLSQLKESELLNELNVLHTEGVKLVDPTDKSGAFRGRDKVHEHLQYLIKNAKQSITLMTSKKGAERKFEMLAPALKKAVKAGVDVKVVMPTGTASETVNGFSSFAKVKQMKESESRFCIIDNKDMLLFLTDDEKVHKSYDCAVWVEAPQFVNYFSTMFDKEWKSK